MCSHIRGVTVHRSHGLAHTTVWTSWFGKDLVAQEKKNMRKSTFNFVYFEQAAVQVTAFFHLVSCSPPRGS